MNMRHGHRGGWRGLRYIWRGASVLIVGLLAVLSLLCLGLYIRSFPIAPNWRLQLPEDLLPAPGLIHFYVFHYVPTERFLGKSLWPNHPKLTAVSGGRLYFEDGNSCTATGTVIGSRYDSPGLMRFRTRGVGLHTGLALNAGPEGSYYWHDITLPLLPMAATFGALPALVLAWLAYRRIRRRRRDPNACLCCGYNLTGNVSGVCPECGEKIDAASTPMG